MEFLWAARPAMGVLAVFLCLASLRLQGYLPVTTVSSGLIAALATTIFFVFCATMLWNDYCDRDRDRQKNKELAYRQPHEFFVLTLYFAGLSIVGIALLFYLNPKVGTLTLSGTTLGLAYNRARQVPFLPTLLVSVGSAAVTLFPWALGPLESSSKLICFFLGVATLIFAREILKDIDDEKDDRGWKQTLPVVLGVERSRRLAGLSLIASMFCVLAIIEVSFVGWLGAFLIGASGLLLLWQRRKHRWCTQDVAFVTLNLSMVIVVAVIFFSP